MIEVFEKLCDEPFGRVWLTVSSFVGSACIGVFVGKGLWLLVKTLLDFILAVN